MSALSEVALRVTARRLLDEGVPLPEAAGRLEDILVAAALIRADGNVSGAARLLKIHRNTLHRKIRRMAPQ